MKSYIKQRTLEVAEYIATSHETIRKTAQVFHLSKSTVHNDLQKRLRKIDSKMYEEVQKILDQHFEEKHIKGGQSTKNKYRKIAVLEK